MALPKVEYPTYDLIIPSSGVKIKYRPFLVREHKLLLQAVEMKDSANFINTIYDIINACTFEKLDVEKLTMYDIDYIFLMLRARSIGELVPVEYRCASKVEQKDEEGNVVRDENGDPVLVDCDSKVRVTLDLNKVQVTIPKGYGEHRVIMFNDTVGIKLCSPSFAKFKELSQIENVDGMFNVAEAFVYSCTECVFDGDKVLVPEKDFTQDDLIAFIEGLPSDVVEKINTFFDNLPYVSLTTTIRCPKCGEEDTIEIKGLEDFFV